MWNPLFQTMKKLIIPSRFPAILLMLSFVTVVAQAQSETGKPFLFSNFQKDKAFETELNIESWLTYSMNESKNGIDYADRADISFRRIRAVAKGEPYSWLQYELEMDLDRLGEDPYASTKGSYCGIDLWKAYVTVKLSKSELINLHLGYYWAAISRDFLTSPWSISSFDKSRADWYLRYFVTGKGNGIENGLGFGGLKNYSHWEISYRLGAYSPEAFTSGEHANPLIAGRLMLSVGDPEQTKYKYLLCGNHWNKRNGITVGFGFSTIGKTNIDDNILLNYSSSYGTDLAASMGHFKIEAEYFRMKRSANGYTDFSGDEWLLRCGYNIPVKGTLIEPTITGERYMGKGAKELFKYIGDDLTIDVGVNWYLNKDKLKLAVHYVNQQGSCSPNVGDYLGMAFVFRL